MSAGFIGVDPGISGALALWIPKTGELVVEDMPTMLSPSGKNRVDPVALAKILADWSAHGVSRATVENVGAMPPVTVPGVPRRMAGTASSFAFGLAAGTVQGVLAGLRIPMVLVVPQVWKRYYNLGGGVERKHESLGTAITLFPKGARYFTRKKDSGRAEAALIAYYGSKLA